MNPTVAFLAHDAASVCSQVMEARLFTPEFYIGYYKK